MHGARIARLHDGIREAGEVAPRCRGSYLPVSTSNEDMSGARCVRADIVVLGRFWLLFGVFCWFMVGFLLFGWFLVDFGGF